MRISRPCAAFPYPVLAEIHATGVRTFSTESPQTPAKFLAEPIATQDAYSETNVHRARLSFDLADLPAALEETFSTHGWVAW